MLTWRMRRGFVGESTCAGKSAEGEFARTSLAYDCVSLIFTGESLMCELVREKSVLRARDGGSPERVSELLRPRVGNSPDTDSESLRWRGG